jgi:single-strand DNA-binding protein
MTKSRTSKPSKEESAVVEQPFRSYNRVQLAGRLVADPELKYTQSGKAVCRVRLATNDTQSVQFHAIVAWEQLAETAAQSLRKGGAVTVEGRLQTRTWDANDGSHRRVTEVVASAVNAA